MNTDMKKKTLYGVDKTGGVKEWSVWHKAALSMLSMVNKVVRSKLRPPCVKGGDT